MTTQKKGFHVAKDAKEQILKRVREEGIPVSQAAQERMITDWTKMTRLSSQMIYKLAGQSSFIANKDIY